MTDTLEEYTVVPTRGAHTSSTADLNGKGKDVELPDSIIDLLEDYRLAKRSQEQAKRDYAAANTAFVQTPGDGTRDALDERMDALTQTARTTSLKAEAVAEALDLWQRQRKGAPFDKTAANPAPLMR